MKTQAEIPFEIKGDILTRNALSVVVIGHVDAGKSSLTGRLLLACNAIDQRAVDKMKAEAEQNNMGSFALAYSTDNNPEERKRGITITTNTKEFLLPSGKHITIVDAPGHRDFINNMISGATTCNCAILVVSAVPTEFRAGIAKTGQTYEHMLLVTGFGVKKIIVAVNKIDTIAADKREATFNEIKDEITRVYKKTGGKVVNLQFVPISGFGDINITSVDAKETPWYKGKGLVDTMESWPLVEHNLTTPTRVAVTGICRVSGSGEVITGKVHTGLVKVGDAIESVPNKFTATIKSIERFKKSVQTAYPDDNIGFTLKGKSDAKVASKKGDLIGSANTGLTSVKRFRGMFAMIGALKNDMSVGFKPVILAHSTKTACTVVSFESIKERKTAKEVSDVRSTVKSGDIVQATFQPEKAIGMEVDKIYGILNKFVVRNSNETIAIGQCKKFDNENYDKDAALKIKNEGKGKAGAKAKKTKKA